MIGSDVPFCVQGGTQRVRGVGERLDELADLKDLYFVVACGKDEMPTPAAYKALDEKYNGFFDENGGGTSDFSGFYDALGDGKSFASKMYNIFECVTLEACPSTVEIKNTLLEMGAVGSLMSGSGPSAFGVFELESDAEKAVDAIRSKGFFCKLCRPIGRY